MKLLLLVLTIISAYLLCDKDLFFIGIFVSLAVVIIGFINFKEQKITFVILLIVFVVFLLYRLISFKSLQDPSNFVGIVIKKSEKYVIVSDGLERLYLKVDEDINLYSIIRIKGSFSEITSHPLESAFDFKEYLAHLGVNRQLYSSEISTIFKFPISATQYRNGILNLFKSSESKEIVNLFLFHKTDYSSEFHKANFVNNLTGILSSCGIYLGYIFQKIKKIFKNHDKELLGIIVGLILFLPILFVNFTSISLRRIYIYNVIVIIQIIRYQKRKKKDKNSHDEFEHIEYGAPKKSSLSVKMLPYLILLLDKWNIYSLAFIIPFLITSFMHFISPRFKQGFIHKFVYPKLLGFLLILPILISLSNTLNLLNLISNFILLPVFCGVFVLILPVLVFLKMPVLEEILGFFYKCLSGINLKILNINLPSFNQYFYVFYYLILLIIFYFKEVNFKRFYRPLSIGFCSILGIYMLPFENLFLNQVNFINIGQGDSTLVQFKGQNYLIDTGGDTENDIATNSLIPYFRKKKIYKIDYVFITHYDVDHYYALDSLKKYFIVGEVYDYNNFDSYAGRLKIKNLNSYQKYADDENSKSLVLKFDIGASKFMVMGDAPIEIEKRIIKDYKNLDIDYLKVGHHGSKTSSCYEFLMATSPKEAIVSCGYNNRYKHPNDEVVDRLLKLGITIRRTDLEGTIKYKFWC